LVADEAVENQYIHAALSRIKYKEYDIDWVTSFAQAREALRRTHYHVLLVDFDIDCRAGSRLIHEIDLYGYHVPVVLFTIHADDRVRGEVESGAYCYLHKHELETVDLDDILYKAMMWEHLKVMFSV
jgi:DNA-binding NtrC family response regulator